jgi:uncharacterized Zn finger protein
MASILDSVAKENLRVMATPATLKAGQEIAEDGEISFGVFRPEHIEAQVARLGINSRHVELSLEDGILHWKCSCSRTGAFCKHVVAVSVAAQKQQATTTS